MTDGLVDPPVTQVDVETAMADWLRAEAPAAAPSDLRRRILERSVTARRTPGWMPRVTMARPIRTGSWAVAAAVVAIAAVTAGLGLLGDQLWGPVGASPSPTALVTSPRPSASESIDTGRWTKGAPPPGAPTFADPPPSYVASIDGRILTLVATGPRTSSTQIDLTAYDPIADQWENLGPIDPAVGWTLGAAPRATVMSGDDLYLVGHPTGVADLVAWRIDGRTLRGNDASLVPRSTFPTVVGRDGRIYLLDVPSNGTELQEPQVLRIYDPARDAWSTAAPIPGPRAEAVLVAARDGSIWVLGGTTVPDWTSPDESPSTGIRSVARYDPTADGWTERMDLPFDTGDFTVGAFAGDGSLYVANIDWSALDILTLRLHRFDPVSGIWSLQDPPPGLLTPAAVYGLDDGRLVLFFAEAGQSNVWGLSGPQVTWILDPTTP